MGAQAIMLMHLATPSYESAWSTDPYEVNPSETHGSSHTDQFYKRAKWEKYKIVRCTNNFAGCK